MATMLCLKNLHPKLLCWPCKIYNQRCSNLFIQRPLCSVQISEDKQPTIQPITEHAGGVHVNSQYAPPGPAIPHNDIIIQRRCVYIQHLTEVLKILTSNSCFMCVFISKHYLSDYGLSNSELSNLHGFSMPDSLPLASGSPWQHSQTTVTSQGWVSFCHSVPPTYPFIHLLSVHPFTPLSILLFMYPLFTSLFIHTVIHTSVQLLVPPSSAHPPIHALMHS